ncbi:hypothetical protein J4448_05640 [Candidatus Woesearchaeota archaeon]|nr:hypothetical protein [Candidatus Woesearchaeota archaeon]
MGWKDWPYWLKGGVIAVGIIILVIVFLVPFGESDLLGVGSVHSSGGGPYWMLPFLPGFILVLIFNPSTKPLGYFLFYGTPLILYFLIGAVIGWIVGKIKSKNI